MYVKVVGSVVPSRLKVTTWPEVDYIWSAGRLLDDIGEPSGQRLRHGGKRSVPASGDRHTPLDPPGATDVVANDRLAPDRRVVVNRYGGSHRQLVSR